MCILNSQELLCQKVTAQSKAMAQAHDPASTHVFFRVTSGIDKRLRGSSPKSATICVDFMLSRCILCFNSCILRPAREIDKAGATPLLRSADIESFEQPDKLLHDLRGDPRAMKQSHMVLLVFVQFDCLEMSTRKEA